MTRSQSSRMQRKGRGGGGVTLLLHCLSTFEIQVELVTKINSWMVRAGLKEWNRSNRTNLDWTERTGENWPAPPCLKLGGLRLCSGIRQIEGPRSN